MALFSLLCDLLGKETSAPRLFECKLTPSPLAHKTSPDTAKLFFSKYLCLLRKPTLDVTQDAGDMTVYTAEQTNTEKLVFGLGALIAGNRPYLNN